MKNFSYIARDVAGMRMEGLRQAICSADVLGWLREQGFTPVSVKEISAVTTTIRKKARRKRIKSADLSALCWQLTTMVEGGIPITTALETVSDDIENLQLRNVLHQILENVKRGENLSDSVAKFPSVFNKLSRAMIFAGETSGNLPNALHRLADYYENKDKLAKKVKGAMSYPIFVFGFIVLIVIAIMTFIIPRFKSIFDQLDNELPAFTQAFMSSYDILRYNLVYIIAVIMMITILLIMACTRTRRGHYIFSRFVLALPLFGKIYKQAFIATFCRTMSTLLSAGVSVLEVFNIVSTMTNNDIVVNAVNSSKENIVQGRNVSASVSTSGFFPNLVVKMIQVGEESGSLSTVLDRTADYYERKVDATITSLMSLLEPVMIVTVGAIVSVVLLALYLPIFTMSDVAK
ncbi:MAG: type II secretion system F family protein [Planctomycetota bacterium]|jgi:type IV pilus assembly protein PilC